MKFLTNSVIACSVLMAGCSTETYCLREQPYDKAESVQPIMVGEGLSLPQSATALKIPPPPANEVPYGAVLAGGPKANHGRSVQCLDQPPPLPATAKLPSSS